MVITFPITRHPRVPFLCMLKLYHRTLLPHPAQNWSMAHNILCPTFRLTSFILLSHCLLLTSFILCLRPTSFILISHCLRQTSFILIKRCLRQSISPYLNKEGTDSTTIYANPELLFFLNNWQSCRVALLWKNIQLVRKWNSWRYRWILEKNVLKSGSRTGEQRIKDLNAYLYLIHLQRINHQEF